MANNNLLERAARWLDDASQVNEKRVTGPVDYLERLGKLGERICSEMEKAIEVAEAESKILREKIASTESESESLRSQIASMEAEIVALNSDPVLIEARRKIRDASLLETYATARGIDPSHVRASQSPSSEIWAEYEAIRERERKGEAPSDSSMEFWRRHRGELESLRGKSKE